MPLKAYMTNLWFLALALQSLLALVLLAKRAWNKFPVFLGYSVFNLCAAAALYMVHGSRVTYFYTYWTCEAIGLILGFGVVYEIFGTILVPYPALRRVATVVCRTAIILLLVLGAIVIGAQSSGERNQIMASILVAEEATRIVELGLLMFLFLFSSAFGLHWRQSAFGITLGLGLFTAVELAAVTLRNHLGTAATQTFGVVRILAFNTSLVVWLGYLLAPERVTSSADVPKTAQLEQWNQAVMELISR